MADEPPVVDAHGMPIHLPHEAALHICNHNVICTAPRAASLISTHIHKELFDLARLPDSSLPSLVCFRLHA